MNASTPRWFKAIIIVLMLPLALYPVLMSRMSETDQSVWLLRLYPVYVIASGICAWIEYRQRPDVAWVLVALLLMSHIGMWVLA